MILLIIGLLLGILYLLYIAISAKGWQALDESQDERSPPHSMRRTQ
jgi:threonine/homoserine/homoserine lactone efflux protein